MKRCGNINCPGPEYSRNDQSSEQLECLICGVVIKHFLYPNNKYTDKKLIQDWDAAMDRKIEVDQCRRVPHAR